jgi:tetrahydromethanopterin S-methyltransferase subunit G
VLRAGDDELAVVGERLEAVDVDVDDVVGRCEQRGGTALIVSAGREGCRLS